MSQLEDDGFIDPRKPMTTIDDDTVLYAINNSDSNIVMSNGTTSATLTTSGHPGCIQLITKDMLKSPGVMALWSTDRIRISTSADVGQRAVSSAQIQMEKDKAHKEQINRIISESKNIPEGGIGKGEDVSFKGKHIVDSDEVMNQAEQEKDESNSEVQSVKPRTRGRKSKKSNSD